MLFRQQQKILLLIVVIDANEFKISYDDTPWTAEGKSHPKEPLGQVCIMWDEMHIRYLIFRM